MRKRAVETEALERPFWETKTLAEMSREEWESLCDGCGQCCLVKLEDEDSDRIFVTRLVCSLFDVGTCRCRDYANRQKLMPDCVKLTPKRLKKIPWLPESCAYRRIAEGRGLEWWHPLVSGDPDTVRAAGVTVGDWAVSEATVVDPDALALYIIDEIEPPQPDQSAARQEQDAPTPA